jgi:hypothetical protein
LAVFPAPADILIIGLSEKKKLGALARLFSCGKNTSRVIPKRYYPASCAESQISKGDTPRGYSVSPIL